MNTASKTITSSYPPSRHAVAGGCMRSILLMSCLPLYANDYIVYSPVVVAGQNEIESRAALDQGGHPSVPGAWEEDLSIAHGMSAWWKSEIYFLKEAASTQTPPRLLGYEFENTFQAAAQGRYAFTPGFLLSYEKSRQAGVPDALEMGPLFERQEGALKQDLNLIWESALQHDVPTQPGWRAAYAARYRYSDAWQPGVEAYLRHSDHSNQIGPTLSGEWPQHRGDELEYSFGAVFGCNHSAARVTWILRLEEEFN